MSRVNWIDTVKTVDSWNKANIPKIMREKEQEEHEAGDK